MKTKKTILFLIAILLVFSACNSSGSDSQKTTLTLYTSEPEELVYQMTQDFNKLHPNVEIEVFRSGTGKVISKMDAEMETGETAANIVWFADIAYIKQLDDENLVLHYSPESSETISDQYKYNDGMAHEVRLIYDIIAYNTNSVSNPPTDWNDLTEPDYTGKVGIANPNYSGGAFTALVAHIQNADKVGWEFYEDLYANDVKFEESNGNLQTKVSSGEYSATIMVDFMARNAQNTGSPVAVVWPESGAVLIPTPVALLNTIPEESKEAAQAFVDYLYSDQAQKLFVKQGYIPVVETAGTPENAPATSDIKTMPFDLEYFTNNSKEIREEYTQRFE